jgi:hypothetical protein
MIIDRQAFVSGTAVVAVVPVVAPLFRTNIPALSASASSRRAFYDRRINFRAGEFRIVDVLAGRQPALPLMLPISWMLVGSPVCPLKPMFKPWVGLHMRGSDWKCRGASLAVLRDEPYLSKRELSDQSALRSSTGTSKTVVPWSSAMTITRFLDG